MKKMMTQSMKRKIPCGFIAAAFAMTLAMTNGCGDGGGGDVSLTPAEKAEKAKVDRYIRVYGRDAIAKYLMDEANKCLYSERDEGEKVERAFKYLKYFSSQGAAVNVKIDIESPIEPSRKIVATPLHWIASLSDAEATNFLVSKGADVNAENSDGLTPLHLAAENSNAEVFQFLADVNAKNRGR